MIVENGVLHHFIDYFVLSYSRLRILIIIAVPIIISLLLHSHYTTN